MTTSGKRVLLLLKPSPARERLTATLTEAGHDVIAKSSTFRAVSSLARGLRDVIVVGVDDLLEEELEVVSVVREECPGAYILLTFSAVNRRKAQHALDLGADGYVLEPLKPEEVVAALRHLPDAWTPPQAPAAEKRTAAERTAAAEPLAPEEVDFITSSLAEALEEEEEAEAEIEPEVEPEPEPEPEEKPFAAPAHGNGFHADEMVTYETAPPPTAVETEVSPDRLASLRKLGASVAHEINNPLTTLSGWIQLLLKKANGNQDLRRTLVNMKEEADRIADVVRELSAISEPELAGRGPTDVNTFAEEVIESFTHANGHANIHVKRIFAPDPPAVKMDEDLFVRAVSDLLNSKYLRLGSSGSLVFTTMTGPDWVEFNVYEPGSQVDLTSFGKALGTLNLGDGDNIGEDLALARCQEIIGSHGATFTAECNPREGLSFQLRMPLDG